MLKSLHWATMARDLATQLNIACWRGLQIGVNAVFSNTLKRQKRSQFPVFVGHLPRGHLNLGRGLDTLEFTLS